MDASTVAADTFSIVSLWNNADWVIKGVMVGLALASLWSWAVIIDKVFRFSTLNAQANKFEDNVGSGRPLEEIAAETGADSKQPLPRLLNAALREWREARTKGVSLGDTHTALLIQRIDRVLDSNIARESQKVEDGLGSLAIVATASPFIG
ncbi:MAG TPA: Tol-Pal system subunit TolQ, partial [Caulobacter sp.]|nr:Tol-Pal system subunit TolQ [Caulobacter sp.]